MKTLFCLVAFSFIATQAFSQTIPPSDARIHYAGRWDRSEPARPWCAWQSSSFRAKFHGTGVDVDIDSGNVDYLRVIVDGDSKSSTRLKISPDQKHYVLVRKLELGEHHIEVVKETYSGEGRMTLLGLQITDGELLKQPKRQPRLRIEFFGDSNLAGYSLEHEKNKGGVGATGCHFTFAGIAARMLGAEYQNTSVSGAIISGRQNSVLSFYDRLDFYHAEPKFDFRSFPADICVINIGANDINKKTKEQIKSNYKKLIVALRKVRPHAHLVVMNGFGWSRNEPANYTHEVLAELDDTKISRLVFPWHFNEWHGCEYDHAGMAQYLVEHLEKLNPQWKSIRTSDVMSGFGRNGDVANGSFENVAPFGGYGWRYFQDGAERIHAPDDSADGSWFLRLPKGKEVHQPNATKPRQKHHIKLKARGKAGSKATVRIEFRDQEWRHEVPDTALEHDLEVGEEWHEFSVEFETPKGPKPGDRSHEPWQYVLRLKSVDGVIDLDDVRASTK